MITLGPEDSGRSIELAVGDLVELRLFENPTTGYVWSVTRDGSPVLDLLDTTFASQSSPRQLGAGGTRCWRFRASAPGTAAMEMEYSRPGDPQSRRRMFSFEARCSG